jgi:SAM-dependent methyltransferase
VLPYVLLMEQRQNSSTRPDRYVSGEYWEANKSAHEEDAEFKVANALKLLRKNSFVPESILDVGCGSGKPAYLLSVEFGVPTVGLDVSEHALDHACRTYSRSNLEFIRQSVAEYPDRAHLGIMFDVFEHVDDYLGFLRSARPKADYWLFNIPLDMTTLSVATTSYLKAREQVGHLHYFSEQSALATLQDCGYQPVDRLFANHVLHGLKTRPSLKRALAAVPRLGLMMFGQSFAVRMLAGASLMVLCKSD